MDDKKLVYPEQDSERPGGETGPAPGKGDARFERSLPAEAAGNRGRRPGMTKAGEVVGSGAGAGGGGGPEDFDSDPVAGGGKSELPGADRPEASHENSNT
jgi:hypothetical protein